jgi:hypothetical protein
MVLDAVQMSNDVLTWEHAIFSTRSLQSFQGIGKFWSLLWGVTLWILWIARNDLVFNNCRWSQVKIEQNIWNGLINYGRGDWVKTVAHITKNPSVIEATLARFDESWDSHEAIYNQQGMKVKWKTTVPAGIG